MINRKVWIIGAIIVVTALLVSAGSYYAFIIYQKDQATKNTYSGDTAPVKSCSTLTERGGQTTERVPFSPTVESTVSVTPESPYQQICLWSLNGENVKPSILVEGKCIYGGRKIMTPGEYELKLSLDKAESNCNESFKFTAEK